MKYNFDEIVDRKNTYSMKYGLIEQKYPKAKEDSIPMWIADMEFATPKRIVKAICKNAKKNRLFGYSQLVEKEYFDAVINYYYRHFGAKFERESIAFSNGIVPAIAALTRLLTKEDEKVIFQTPCYFHFDADVKKTGRETVYNQLILKDGKYEIDFEDFEKKCSDEKVTLFILCSPHNPTGRIWTKEELIKLAEICFSHNVKIVSDEIHSDLLRVGEKHIVLDSLFPHDKRIFTCTAPSKTFNVAGLQLSNIIFNDIDLKNQWIDNELAGIPNPLSIYACISAYTECDDWLYQLRQYLDNNFRYTAEFISKNMPKAKFTIPQGTFLAWIDLSGYGYTFEEIMERTQKEGVLIQGQPSFIDNSVGFVRLNVGCPLSMLKEGLIRLKNALE